MKILYKFKTLAIVVVSLAMSNHEAHAWDPSKTHNLITEYAVRKSVLSKDNGDYLKNIEYTLNYATLFQWNTIYGSERKTAIKWMSDVGALLEDTEWRELNHFFNPLQKDWANAGFRGMFEATPVWAQDSSKQATWGKPANAEQQYPKMMWDLPDDAHITDWSWQTTRGYFYSAMTSKLDSNRQTNFAKMFRGLGQQMHLLQDMSVPAHVRNDAHLFNRWIEAWVGKTKISLLDEYPKITIPDVDYKATNNSIAVSPVANLYDTNTYTGQNPKDTSGYDIGLAEYTNANFVSPDTIFTDFAYPSPVTSVSTTTRLYKHNGAIKTREYYWKDNDGDTGYLLAGKSFLSFEKTKILPGDDAALKYVEEIPPMDNNVHSDYADRLLPRAIGYSTALINYFFRGTLEISRPGTYVYAIADGNVDADPYIYTDNDGKKTFKHQWELGTLLLTLHNA